MTIISANCIAKSKHPTADKILSTVECVYPRWIHAEGRTHRQLALGEDNAPEYQDIEYRTPSPMECRELSRNASSSRAMPVAKMIQDIMEHPAIPLFWGKNIKGMQAGEEINEPVMFQHIGPNGSFVEDPFSREDAWLLAMESAIKYARAFDKAGYAKQIVNRLLEPFSHIKVIFTGTEWTNFFALRIHKDAEPHIMMLAQCMKLAINQTEARTLQFGEWHLPYVMDEDRHEAAMRHGWHQDLYWGDLRRVSVGRCARTSYRTHDNREPNFEEDSALHDRLVASAPLHASPTEHQGTPDRRLTDGDHWLSPHLHANFVGFCQYRKGLAGECIT